MTCVCHRYHLNLCEIGKDAFVTESPKFGETGPTLDQVVTQQNHFNLSDLTDI